MDTLEERHRVERKELREKSMEMLKGVKNNKKNKKIVRKEIDEMEKELKIKHELEKSAIVVKEEELEQVEHVEKFSKGQRRREAREAKSRSIRAEAQAEANLMTDYRKLENEALNVQLEQKSLKVFEIISDGHCLFRAVSMIIGNEDRYQELRCSAIEYIRSNASLFIGRTIALDGNVILDQEQLNNYCEEMMSFDQQVHWGGEAEILALSHYLYRPIIVFCANAEPLIITSDEFALEEPITISFHKHYYTLGNHYNAVVSL